MELNQKFYIGINIILGKCIQGDSVMFGQTLRGGSALQQTFFV